MTIENGILLAYQLVSTRDVIRSFRDSHLPMSILNRLHNLHHPPTSSHRILLEYNKHTPSTSTHGRLVLGHSVYGTYRPAILLFLEND